MCIASLPTEVGLCTYGVRSQAKVDNRYINAVVGRRLRVLVVVHGGGLIVERI